MEVVSLLGVVGYLIVAIRDVAVVGPLSLLQFFLLRDALMVAFFLSLNQVLMRDVLPRGWAHPMAFLSCVLPCLGTALGVHAGGDFIPTGYFFLIIITAALVMLNISWFLSACAITIVSWGVSFMPYFEKELFIEQGITLVSCCLVAGVALTTRRNELHQQYLLLETERSKQSDLREALNINADLTSKLDQEVEKQTSELSRRLEELHQSKVKERKLGEETARLARVESVGRLVGGLGHRFNNLFTVMLGNTTMLQEIRVDQDRTQEGALLDRMEGAILRASRATQPLAYLTNPDLEKVDTLNLKEIYLRLKDFLESSLSPKHQYRCDLATPSQILEVNLAALYQLLLNLFITIDQTLPDRGSLHLLLESTENEATFTLECRTEPDSKTQESLALGNLDTLNSSLSAISGRLNVEEGRQGTNIILTFPTKASKESSRQTQSQDP